MRAHQVWLAPVLLDAVFAMQPSALPPYEAPLRELPWAKLNFLHTTDTHGWLGGHLQEPSFSADWGDYISFASHLRARADEDDSDLLIVDTGDRVEGNGLYDASDPKGQYLFDIYKQQRVDLICSGNHELYKANSSNNELHVTVPDFKDNYIASNLDIFDPKTGEQVPLAQRFRKFETKNQKLRILAFGFLFDFNMNANNTVVQPVAETVKEEWFQKAVRDREVDLIVVIGHVGIRMKEFETIYKAIREVQWDTPMAFFGGHVHIRDFTKYDRGSAAIGSGRYMETIGFLSIDGISGRKKPGEAKAEASLKFSRRYVDNNLYSLRHHSGKNETSFATELGKEVSKSIASARKRLDLGETRGCAPQTLYVNRAPYPSNNSIFTWLENDVFPTQLGKSSRIAKENKKALALTNTGAMRFDIFEGPFTRDTEFLVSPFTSGFRFIADVPLKVAAHVLSLLNGKGPMLDGLHSDGGSQRLMLAPPEQWSGRLDGLARAAIDGSRLSKGFGAQMPLMPADDQPERLKPGYTTIDDAGEDGDDTEHSHISFFAVPNCIQSAIGFKLPEELESVTDDEVVDLVYNEFIQPYLLLALEYLNFKKTEADTHEYLKGKSITNIMTDWISEHWKC
jgi:2',3'-cyclic-nucleotide 2'-phosphodiesterase (5'-nucleotidase family)